MERFQTHYDNLQVSRNAAPEVIVAAYRRLSLKYHPDRNAGDVRCEKIMRLVNKSYAVLSDPARRKAHDSWIADMEAKSPSGTPRRERRRSEQWTSQPDRASSKPQRYYPDRDLPKTAAVLGWIAMAGGVLALVTLLPLRTTQPSGLPPYDPAPTPKLVPIADPFAPANLRTDKAPNGSPWPKAAGYIKDYPRLRSEGLSTVTIYNSKNAYDVFVKVVAIDPDGTKPVRQFFIPAYGKFTAKQLAPGKYDVRYRNLSDGSLLRSEGFNLRQWRERGGTTAFSKVSMSLYVVADGNLKTFPLLPAEF